MAQYYYSPNELYHYGILGMKWGVRRYQNADGTLTAAGKKRYNARTKAVTVYAGLGRSQVAAAVLRENSENSEDREKYERLRRGFHAAEEMRQKNLAKKYGAADLKIHMIDGKPNAVLAGVIDKKLSDFSIKAEYFSDKSAAVPKEAFDQFLLGMVEQYNATHKKTQIDMDSILHVKMTSQPEHVLLSKGKG